MFEVCRHPHVLILQIFQQQINVPRRGTFCTGITMYLFTIPYGSDAMDQGSGVG